MNVEAKLRRLIMFEHFFNMIVIRMAIHLFVTTSIDLMVKDWKFYVPMFLLAHHNNVRTIFFDT